MKKLIIVAFIIFISAVLLTYSVLNRANARYKQLSLNTGSNAGMIENVVLGRGRSDGIMRLYTTSEWWKTPGYEYTFSGGRWSSLNIYSAGAYCTSPVIADIKNEGRYTLYLGGWNNSGVLFTEFSSAWQEPAVIEGSPGKANIMAMKAGLGRNDGVKRLYVSYLSAGLFEYSWGGQSYVSRQLLKKGVGEFAVGQGRNDGINRIYAVLRGSRDVHELTWNAGGFTDELIFTGNHESNGSVHVADGRGDGIKRIYVWAGGLFELTREKGKWSALTLDEENIGRYHITAGTIRNDKQPCVYVSVQGKGIYEYSWSGDQNRFSVDAITGATGGCAIGDGRGDGKNRLYAAGGNRGKFKKAVVEIWEEDGR